MAPITNTLIRYSFSPNSFFDTTIGAPVVGWGIGEVIESKNSAYPVKSVVTGFNLGWEQYTRLNNPQGLWVIPDGHDSKIPITEFANALGSNGLSAYAAIKASVNFKKDQVVYISSAAGPVGSFLALLAKREGVFVIGSTSSDEKVEYLVKDLGLDAAINYKTKDLRTELDAVAPNGIDIYFDLVGAETLDIALEKLKPQGQVIALGALAAHGPPYESKYLGNLGFIISKSLTVTGFTLFHHLHKMHEFWAEYTPLIANGEIKSQKQTVIKGIENAPQAFMDYLNGKYHGKVIIDIANL
ncbi:hypothetical protein BGZ80_010634 [Entomortierella chlamydospora]|uniref:Alcohol dehydrogenase-like C-terminal domain-containing protein n=1 Tax=Entomortierella chlamydospora TaxID=101097 RepID=A0A9P6MUI9_9FUNG|nr:hypothetical protein BGZ80_010634 [Entomortierella chlamydospora]